MSTFKNNKSEMINFDNTKEGVNQFLAFIKMLSLMPIKYNRGVQKGHAKKMAESVKSIGVRRRILVIKTACFDGIERLYIGDGQHLVKGILMLKPSDIYGGLEVEIIEVTDLSQIIPFVSELNSTAKNWSIKEYLNSWVTHGLKDYKDLLTVHETTKFGISPLIEAYSGKRGNGNKDFKQGKFIFNKAKGDNTLRMYLNACNLVLNDCNSAFLAFVRMCTDFPKLNENKLNVGMVVEPHFKLLSAKATREYYLMVLRAIINPTGNIKRSGKKSKKVNA